jgi:hypothetical protein
MIIIRIKKVNTFLHKNIDTQRFGISNVKQKSLRSLIEAGLFKSKQGINLEGTGLSNYLTDFD